jgi:hypothetical protein
MIKGKLVISLDFEIYWGVRDAVKLTEYKAQLFGVQKVIPILLEMFAKYQINATFATVGFLFFNNKEELINNLPKKKPQYFNSNLSPYTNHFNYVGENEEKDPFHFASNLIQQIKDAGQEIGSHTFSHYYCLEKGQTTEEFVCDLLAAKIIAEKKDIVLKSFVFPRNQYNRAYLDICKKMGFTSFRGNEKSWLFSSKSHGSVMFFRRPFRLLDSYFNLSGHNCYSFEQMKTNEPFNISSSRFLRPYDKKLKAFENLRLKRIKDSMTYAANQALVYHLWWHPHNFGTDMQENFSFLEKILIHFSDLNRRYNFESMSMCQLSNELMRSNE